ncbi:MAG: hypothetical protein K2X50_04260 [Gammaproteobacteria bacterium]|nr:hypothetical protein [Gammaproteobacteria bacterium]
MRVKKLTGTYREICTDLHHLEVLGVIDFLSPLEDQKLRHQVQIDLERTPMFGNFTQKMQIRNSWANTTQYTQGDAFGGINIILPLSYIVPLDQEELEVPVASFSAFKKAMGFGYWSDNNEACGISLIYKQINPQVSANQIPREENWMCCTITNAAATLDERIVTIYFSEALCERFEALHQLPLENVNFYADLKESLQCEEVFELVQKIIKSDGKANIDEIKKIDDQTPVFSYFSYDELSSAMRVIDKKSKLNKLKDSISLKKARLYMLIMDLIGKSNALNNKDHFQNANILLKLANGLFERCEPFLSLTSIQFTHADWSALQSECQSIIGDARNQLKEFQLPEDFFKLELLYIELYCKRGNLLCQNKTLSFRKAQVYDQLMSMIDSVQDLQEKWHDEDACRLLALISDLKVRFERLLLLPEDQISAADWLRLQVECNTLIRDAKKNIAHCEIPEKWCSLELTYLELQEHKKQCRRSNDILSRKKAKVYTHLLELLDKADSMKRSEYRDDAQGAIELALRLTETCRPYLCSSSTDIDWKRLKKECKVIVSEAEYKLAYYGFLQLILANLLLAVTGLCLLKAAFTGSFFIHNSSEECAQEIQETASLVRTFGSAAG